eukprot:s2336_g10.t1
MASALLEQAQKKKLRQLGRDCFYRQHGTARDTSLERKAHEAKGANSRRRDLDSWKRNECEKRFLKLTREQQLAMCPEFAAYHADMDERTRFLAAPASAADSDTGAPLVSDEVQLQDQTSAARQRQHKRKRGRGAKSWANKGTQSKRRNVRTVLASLSAHCEGPRDMALFLKKLLRDACSTTPGLAQSLHSYGIGIDCHCVKLTRGFVKLLEKPIIANTTGMLHAVGTSLHEAGFTNRRTAKKIGLDIPKRATRMVWREAKQEEPSTLLPRGRPSMLNSAKVRALVRQAAETNSQDSSKFMIGRDENGERTPVIVRHWTLVPSRVYRSSVELMQAMSYRTFMRILQVECPHVKRGSKLTDYCDHCHLFETSVVPFLGFPNVYCFLFGHARVWFCSLSRQGSFCLRTVLTCIRPRKMRALFTKIHETLTAIYPAYFQHMGSIDGLDPSAACKMYLTYLNSHTQKYRKEIRRAGRNLIFRLHEQEAELEHSLKQELSVFGIVVHAGQTQGTSRKFAFVVVSDVIEHTALAAALQLELLKSQLPMNQVAHCHLWMDQGPHFKTLDLCAYVGMQCASKETANIPTILSWFGEKHGKGECDGLFGCCSRWLQEKTRVPNTLIQNVTDVIACFQEGAQKDMEQHPDGPTYKILHWNPAQKPSYSWKGESDDLQIRKTYCLSAKTVGNVAAYVQWKNHVFSDAVHENGKAVTVCSRLLEIPAAEREWRRGHFNQKKWETEFPTKTNALLNRHEDLQSFDKDLDALGDPLEKKVARYERQLAVKESRQDTIWVMLTNQSCWSVPFFGALSALARRLSELPEFEPDADPYRVQIFQQLDLPWQGPISSISYGNHLKMQGEPMMNWEATREKTFRKACAFLATAKVAERYFRIYHQVSLPSGRCATVSAPLRSRVLDLKLAAQQSLEHGFLKLAGPDGHLLDVAESLQSALQDGDTITAVAQKPKIVATLRAFALWCPGEKVVTWGHRNFGADSSRVQDKLKNVQEVYATQAAFAAILVDGSVVTWGDPSCGGDCTRVREKLRNVQRIHATESNFAAVLADESLVIWGANGSKVRDPAKKIKQICENPQAFAAVFSDGTVGTSGHQYFGGDSSRVRDKLKSVQKLHATERAFAALLADGSVVTWGDPNSGGDSTKVRDQLNNVQEIYATGNAFAAILADGSAVSWGHPMFVTNDSEVGDQLKNVQHICANQNAFAAMTSDGTVVTWGDPNFGGDSTTVKDQLRKVQRIHSTERAFAAILSDGSVVTWGDPDFGGDSTGVQDKLKNVQEICAKYFSFAAILEDRTVVTWGDPKYCGDSSKVQDQLRNVQQIQATRGSFAAIKANGTVVTWGNPNFGGDCARDSLGIVLYAAAQWPVFDLLHRLALRPRVEDDVLKSEDSEADEESFEEFFVEAGKQRLSPDLALEFYRMFHVVGTLFNAMRVQWWVSHGTLIGALRDRGLSRHADDCEIDVSERDVELMQSVGMKAALSRNGYELSYDPRGRCFKVWPSGSRQAEPREAQLVDQSWWLPQQRVGTPALDIYVVQTPEASQSERYYISNDVFHCNTLSCTQYWTRWELSEFYDVPFGLSTAKVPRGAAWYLDRVYGADWNVTVRPHNYASQHGEGFEPMDVSLLKKRAAEPFGPLPLVL